MIFIRCTIKSQFDLFSKLIRINYNCATSEQQQQKIWKLWKKFEKLFVTEPMDGIK